MGRNEGIGGRGVSRWLVAALALSVWLLMGMESCNGNGPPAGFELLVSPASVELQAGGAAQVVTVTVARLGGFEGDVALAVSGLPEAVSAELSVATVGLGSTSQLTLRAHAGAVVGDHGAVRVEGYAASLDLVTERSVGLRVLPGAPAGPANDAFADAVVLDGREGTVEATSVGATKESGEPRHAGNAGGASVWWSWTPAEAGEVTFDTFGSDFDTLLAVYQGSAVDALSVVASNDDTDGRQSQVRFEAEEDATYYVAVDGFGGASGAIVLNWRLEPIEVRFTLALTGSGGQVRVAGDAVALPWEGAFAANASVALEAVPSDGFEFDGWSGSLTGSENPVTVVMDEDHAIEARFSRPPVIEFALDVSLEGDGAGSVTSDPEGIECGEACSFDFDEGEEVALSAEAAEGSAFVEWGGACSGSSSVCTLTMSEARSVSATFALESSPPPPEPGTERLSVTLMGSGSGAVTSDPAGIDCGEACSAEFDAGEDVTLSAEATEESEFVGWGGACSGTSLTCVVSMTEARSVSATFEPPPPPGKQVLSVSSWGTGEGTVTSDAGGINCGEACSAEFDEGDDVTLSASAASGSVFVEWGGACSGSSPTCVVSMTQARAVSARFEGPRTLTLDRSGTGSGSVSSSLSEIDCGTTCSAEFAFGANVTLTATASADSVFTGWSGACTGTSASVSVSMTQHRSCTAGFAERPTLSVSRSGTGSGTVTSSPSGVDCGSTCSAQFDPDATVTLTATAASDSTFAAWSGCESSSGTQCTVSMTHSRSVTATFNQPPSEDKQTLSVSPIGSGSGTVTSNPSGINCGATCSAEFDEGDDVTLTASAASGSSFEGWGGACSGTGSCTVTMSEARSVTARFEVRRTLQVTRSGSGTGTVTSDPSGIDCGGSCSAQFVNGITVTLSASVGSNSEFTGWSGDCSGSGTSTTVSMTQDRSCTATFDLEPQVSVSPSSLSFGSVEAGSCSSTQPFSVTNAGGGSLSGTVSVSAPFEITVGGSFSGLVSGGSAHQVRVRFCPPAGSSSGGVSRSVSFSSNGGNVSRSVSGTVTLPPEIRVTPSSILWFAGVPVGSSRTLGFEVCNTGGGTLSGTVSTSQPFSIVGSASYSISSQECRELLVRFTPETADDYSRTVSFTGGGGATRRAEGFGVPPQPPSNVRNHAVTSPYAFATQGPAAGCGYSTSFGIMGAAGQSDGVVGVPSYPGVFRWECVSWEPSTAPGLSGYVVFRRAEGETRYTSYGWVPADTTTWVNLLGYSSSASSVTSLTQATYAVAAEVNGYYESALAYAPNWTSPATDYIRNIEVWRSGTGFGRRIEDRAFRSETPPLDVNVLWDDVRFKGGSAEQFNYRRYQQPYDTWNGNLWVPFSTSGGTTSNTRVDHWTFPGNDTAGMMICPGFTLTSVRTHWRVFVYQRAMAGGHLSGIAFSPTTRWALGTNPTSGGWGPDRTVNACP